MLTPIYMSIGEMVENALATGLTAGLLYGIFQVFHKRKSLFGEQKISKPMMVILALVILFILFVLLAGCRPISTQSGSVSSIAHYDYDLTCDAHNLELNLEWSGKDDDKKIERILCGGSEVRCDRDTLAHIDDYYYCRTLDGKSVRVLMTIN